MSFSATGSLTATASTKIHVTNVDRAPVVTCPSAAQVGPGGTFSFTVTASDPDGDAITSLTMVPTKLPPNSGATFTPNATNTSGTFTWVTTGFSGNSKVSFEAANALIGSLGTNLQIKKKDPKNLAGAGEALTEGVEASPTVLAFSSGFPNPSHSAIEFMLDLPQDANVKWAVFDLQGRTVWSESRSFAAGRTRLRWDGTAGRSAAAPGIYLVRAWVDGATFTRRVVRF